MNEYKGVAGVAGEEEGEGEEKGGSGGGGGSRGGSRKGGSHLHFLSVKENLLFQAACRERRIAFTQSHALRLKTRARAPDRTRACVNLAQSLIRCN